MAEYWSSNRLDSIASIQMGQSPPGSNSNHDGVGFPLLNGPTEFGSRWPSPVQWSENPPRVCQTGDVLFCVRGSTTGRMNEADQPYAIGRGLCAIRGLNADDSKFVRYALHLTLPALLSGVTGSTFPNLSRDQIARHEIPIPPHPMRRAISEILSALDDNIAANEDAARAALALGDELLVDALSTHDGTPTTIGDLADQSLIQFSDGYRTKKSEHGRPGLRILRAGDVRGSYVYPAGKDYVSREYSRQIGAKASKPGDIVLTTKGTVGRVAVIAEAVEPVVYSPQVCFFRVTDENRLDQGFLAAWFRSADLKRQAATLMFKSDMAPYISLRDIRSLVVPLPSIEYQREVGNQQRALLGAFNATRAENASLARTRDELLPLLMSGKVRVKDAEAVASEAL